MFIRISMTVHRIFEVDPTSYSDDGITPESHEEILKAELNAVVHEQREFLENALEHFDDDTTIITDIQTQEVVQCPTPETLLKTQPPVE